MAITELKKPHYWTNSIITLGFMILGFLGNRFVVKFDKFMDRQEANEKRLNTHIYIDSVQTYYFVKTLNQTAEISNVHTSEITQIEEFLHEKYGFKIEAVLPKKERLSITDSDINLAQ